MKHLLDYIKECEGIAVPSGTIGMGDVANISIGPGEEEFTDGLPITPNKKLLKKRKLKKLITK